MASSIHRTSKQEPLWLTLMLSAKTDKGIKMLAYSGVIENYSETDGG